MDRPKLRGLERLRLRRDDEDLIVLRDPLGLCEPFAIDAVYEPVLDALDGQRTVAQVRQSLLMRGRGSVDLDDLLEFVAELGELGLLDDDQFRALWATAHDTFVEQELREARLAGLLYPSEPEQLRAWLGPALPTRAGSQDHSGGAPLAIIAPHQPPPSCAGALRRLLAGLPEPERYNHVVILATDHSPGLLPYAVSDKDLATPLGPVRADLGLLATIEDRLDWPFREQIRLRTCDPLEWSALLLRGLWGDRCPPVLAVACGQTRLTSADALTHAREFDALLHQLLAEPSRAGKVLWWVAAELSHVGPAFGQAELPNPVQLERDNRSMLAALLDNRPHELAASLMDRPANLRASGSAALVALAQQLPPDYRATLLDYQAVAAAGDEPGWIGCVTVRVDPPA